MTASPALTPVQITALAQLATGATVTAAATAAGVHRTTIHHWCRHIPSFAAALSAAIAARRAEALERMNALVDPAIAAVRAILEDPAANPSTRLRAAQTILRVAAADADSTPNQEISPEHLRELDLLFRQPAPDVQPDQQSAPSNEIQHNSSESTKIAEPPTPAAGPTPAIARSARCPCGSGRKFKRCCGSAAHGGSGA